MAKVVLENLVKTYFEKKGSSFQAVNGISLEIKDREFMVLVGPSGCGKSTTLRMIAGLEDISSGTISIDGRVVNDVPPKDRDIAMVFQNYALYPHMNVHENMAFGLKLRKFPKAEIDARVREAAGILGLESLLERKPKALSGGQRQRVALGRALVRKPKVFLFDEPLSNLDAMMRVAMRAEIAKLHTRLGATMVYVTHDQVEAMTMGDRICVMKDGNIMQVDEPLRIYNQPANHYTASFIGSPPMNFLRGTLVRNENRLWFRETNDQGTPVSFPLDERLGKLAAASSAREVLLGVRPEDLNPTPAAPLSADSPVLDALVEVAEPMGAETLLYAGTGAHSLIARLRPTDQYKIGTRVQLFINPVKLHLFDANSGLALE